LCHHREEEEREVKGERVKRNGRQRKKINGLFVLVNGIQHMAFIEPIT
jgi:hypothetical protein